MHCYKCIVKLTINDILLFQSPCSSKPCQNGGTCVTNYKDNTLECLCHKGFIGEYCEQGKGHSKNLLHFNKYNYNLAQLGCGNYISGFLYSSFF